MLEKAWETFRESQSTTKIARALKISKPTAERIRRQEDFDNRWLKIKEQATIIADAKSAKRLAQNLVILQQAKTLLVEQLSKGELKGSYSDLAAIIREERAELGIGELGGAISTVINLNVNHVTIESRAGITLPAGLAIPGVGEEVPEENGDAVLLRKDGEKVG